MFINELTCASNVDGICRGIPLYGVDEDPAGVSSHQADAQVAALLHHGEDQTGLEKEIIAKLN